MLIVAGGEAGEAAAGALADRDLRRVDTIAGAREALGDATVVLVGDPADGTPVDARDVAREAGLPVVGLGGDAGGYDATADPDDAGALRNAVELAERAAEYRAAVDDLFEQSRARAEGDLADDDRDLQAARDRAHRRLRDLRETTGRVPYENVLGPDHEDEGRARDDGEDDDGDEDGDGDVNDGEDGTPDDGTDDETAGDGSDGATGG